MFACVLDTVTSDTESEQPAVDFEPKLAESYEMEGLKNTREYNDTDFLIDGTQDDDIQTDNRVKAEKGWRIGYNHVMELFYYSTGEPGTAVMVVSYGRSAAAVPDRCSLTITVTDVYKKPG